LLLQTRAVVRMNGSSPAGATGNGRAAAPSAIAPAPAGQHRARDPWLRVDAEGAAVALPGAGYPGHGRTASLRRQPIRIVDGRMEGGYTGLFELICPSCGDHPYLDYSEIPARLQWLRGPRTLKGGVAAYEKHLGLALRPDAA
jgi:hypothetical protein